VPLAIFGATNHQHQLDSAIWRRFTFHFRFDFPDYNLRKQIIKAFLDEIKRAKIGVDNQIFTSLNEEYNRMQKIEKEITNKMGQKVTEFDDMILWNEISKKIKGEGLLKLTHGYSGSDIERGTKVALLKAITVELLTYDLFFDSLKLVGGTAIHVERQNTLGTTRGFDSSKDEGNEKKRNRINKPPEI